MPMRLQLIAKRILAKKVQASCHAQQARRFMYVGINVNDRRMSISAVNTPANPLAST
ncbi:hypothetical protein BOSE62_40182 [Bosea sp. 62]|nr:hypothetical protein BOSE46_120606 [Bosea sp. 46]CAD5263667.1 hypothetical protein BOSE21B_110838 [Bosea sp. 21B]CAD5276611.1 hypothetical protein BOSE7B_40379 [Bosea sp. 7B]VVT59020.1 hypothetical protein BOS5A_200887 [Bosea sp. EC-HK365B]VXB65849.1 hypothetical protein BOSE29B_110771 [Bosea sp. 29B]VXC06261.1 hypothetical protein BOSE125_160562 [Bosea sp. 125]VXC35262.1 hypothetical protein BOSE62_40182 [Bosea sp. 62]VXC77882.1 hypothetical protein BOSE127_50086 [Bosea sp. 127]